MSETQSGSDHQVLAPEEMRLSAAPVRIGATHVLRMVPQWDQNSFRLRSSVIHVARVNAVPAACVLGQTGGLPGDVVLHLLKGILEGVASLRGEGRGQKAPAGDVLTDVADHRDLEVLKGVVAHVSNRGPPQAV